MPSGGRTTIEMMMIIKTLTLFYRYYIYTISSSSSSNSRLLFDLRLKNTFNVSPLICDLSSRGSQVQHRVAPPSFSNFICEITFGTLTFNWARNLHTPAKQFNTVCVCVKFPDRTGSTRKLHHHSQRRPVLSKAVTTTSPLILCNKFVIGSSILAVEPNVSRANVSHTRVALTLVDRRDGSRKATRYGTAMRATAGSVTSEDINRRKFK